MEKENIPPRKSGEGKNTGMTRRELLKGLASLPVFGLFFQQLFQKITLDSYKKDEILAEFGREPEAPTVLPQTVFKKPGELIRVGIIGFGNRGESLARSLGFAHPDWLEACQRARDKNKLDTRLKDWLSQEDLNVALTGICEVFDLRGERGLAASRSELRPGGASGSLQGAKRYRDYREMLHSKEVDAVIIATPDHHHAPMTIEAVNAGKHVYCEKCMTRTEEEVQQVVEAVKKSGMVFQLGHQNSQNDSYHKAREIVQKNILGKITLVETTTNRNTPDGAWIRHIDRDGNPRPGGPQTIDWEGWLGSRPWQPFSLDRYYNWTKWWDYATGLSGQLLSHEVDAVNQILGAGIPHSAVASGGIYFYKDNREIPDVFQVVFEFPDKELTMIYSASLASSRRRGRVFMGHDASMEVGNTLKVTVDERSTRYEDKIDRGIIDPTLPLFSYQPGLKGIAAVTSATERYYVERGLLYTYRNGRRVDTAHLHLKEWLECIRNGGTPSCNIDKGFEVTMACHMATRSYRENRRVEWDPLNRRIV